MSAGETRERGALIVITAPSGAGKTTLVHGLLERMPKLCFSVSYTTRAPRASEKNGVDYFFVTPEEFRRMIAAGEFLEHALVFDHWYGTSAAHVESLRARGLSVLLEIDWQGAEQVKRRVPDALGIFIVPPSVAELERRLRGRGSDSEGVIQRRLRDSLSDLEHWRDFDYVIVNDDLELALDELTAVVCGRGQANRREAPEIVARIDRILAGAQ